MFHQEHYYNWWYYKTATAKNLILVIFNCECACVCKCDIPIHLGTCSFLLLLKSIQGYVNICNIQENGTKKESSFLVVPFSASSTSLHSATFQVCCCRWWWWSSSLKCGWLVNFHQLKFLPSSTFHGEYNIGIVLGIIYSFSHQPFTIITRLRLWPCHVMCLLHLIVFWPRHSIMHIILHHCHQNVQHAGRHRHHRNNHDHSPKNLRNFTQVARKVFAERSNCIKFRILEVFNVPQGNVFPIVITIDVHVYYYHLYNSFTRPSNHQKQLLRDHKNIFPTCSMTCFQVLTGEKNMQYCSCSCCRSCRESDMVWW